MNIRHSLRATRSLASQRALLLGASALWVCIGGASAVYAQDASPATQDSAGATAQATPLDQPASQGDTTRPPNSNGAHVITNPNGVSEVVVTARRQAIQNAVVRKEKADQIQDSIVADEAGKLPEASVTEVLQRLPGVSITRFDAVGDPDHYSAEGSGLAVRGLTQINSTLNGREVFSANGGRTLLFEDVPPELLAGVDVIKSSTPDLIEGGIGGDVNLRTKQPFDYTKMTLNAEVNANYSDFVDQGRPGGSILWTNNWQTGIGKVGLLLDIAYSDLANRADTIQAEPYFPQTFNGQNVYVPGGFDYRTRDFDRKRLGSYEALQWAPNDNLRFFQTFFRSDYRTTSLERGVYNTGGNSITVAPGSDSVFGSSGGLISSNELVDATGYDPLVTSGAGSVASTDIGYDRQHSYTQDFSQGFTWRANSNLTVNSAFQFVYSQSTTDNIDVFGETTVPSYGINLAGNLPSISVSNNGSLANPSNYIWDATMDHLEDHIGRLFSWNTDADLHLSEHDFFRDVKFGVRLAEQNESDDVSAYNWTGLTPYFDYNPSGPALNYIGNAPASDYTVFGFPNYFQGMANLPGSAVFPSLSLLKQGIAAIHQQFGFPGDTTGAVAYTPYNEARSRTVTEAIYGQVQFGTDALIWPMEGNFGLRVVNDSNKSTGAISQPTGTIGVLQADGTVLSQSLPGGGINYGGGRTRVEVLPALNFQFLPRPDVHLRFAGSQTMTNPSFSNLAAGGSIGLLTNANQTVSGYTATIGNPTLKPQISNNLDFSAEWYPKGGGTLHFAAFYKQIRDYISYGAFSETLPVALPGGTRNETVAVTNYFNSQPATIKGMEVGGERFFDFLPAPFNGLGLQANFTYLDSQSPGDLSYDMNGNRITGLPVDLLSRYNYNIVGEYERGPLSMRLAWDWRSKYLLTPTANGTNGTYTSATGSSVVYNLPVFSGSYGQLDLGFSYAFTKNVTVVFDAQNLTDTVARTYMGYGAQQYGRSWFVTDRRYETALRFNF